MNYQDLDLVYRYKSIGNAAQNSLSSMCDELYAFDCSVDSKVISRIATRVGIVFVVSSVRG